MTIIMLFPNNNNNNNKSEIATELTAPIRQFLDLFNFCRK